MNQTIRHESPTDAAAIHALTRAAFLNAPHTAHTEQFIVDDLRDAGALTVSLVAERERVIVGHVAISPATVSDGTPDWYHLGPISVTPAHQREGIGTQLMSASLQQLREAGAAGCILVGDAAYYGRFGFAPDDRLTFPGLPPEYFLVLPFTQSVPRGTVGIHDAFTRERPPLSR